MLLGAQRFDPTLGDAMRALGVKGPVAIITAGWQEREAEDEELVDYMQGRVVNLRLHARAEEVFAADPELRAAHRERQEATRHRREFYRIRLEHALEADRVIRQRAAPPDIRAEQTDESLGAVRDLDALHLAHCIRLRREFEAQWNLGERPAIVKQREELERLVAGCDAVAIAGGHVATLINRLHLFDITRLVRGKVVFAWSGGAMAISDRLVLFHDDAPHGPAVSEVLEAGLGLAPGVVVLPQPEQRLHLDDAVRVSALARRFAPAKCLAFPARSWASLEGTKWTHVDGVVALNESGESAPFAPKGAKS